MAATLKGSNLPFGGELTLQHDALDGAVLANKDMGDALNRHDLARLPQTMFPIGENWDEQAR